MKPWSNTPLNLEEFYEAIEEGKKKKWFRLQHCDYWLQQENKKKVKQNVTNI
jgi:hypothetical protein